MLKYMVLLGALVQVIGIASYVKDTLKGKTQPNRITWFLWTVNGFIATVAAYMDGVSWAVIPVFMSGVATFLVFASSFVNQKAYWKLKIGDYICGIFSVLALILWGVTDQPIIAIVFAILSDVLATWPTIIKAWKHPDSESAAAYFVGIFNSLTTFFALELFSVSELAFPIYNILVNLDILIALYRDRSTTKT